MTESALKQSQLQMARYLRDPRGQPAPPVEARRLKVYEDLVYNNIEGFISGGFPVLHSLYQQSDWHTLVRSFIDQHRCHTPYFLEISQEFLRFLMEVHTPRAYDPAFLIELAHYEWVELALDVSQENLPERFMGEDVLGAIPQLSPLAMSLRYEFPVHRVGPAFRPEGIQEATYLVVYRNWDDQVKFMEINAPVARLLELVMHNDNASVRDILSKLAREMGMSEEAMLAFGGDQFEQFFTAGVVIAALPRES